MFWFLYTSDIACIVRNLSTPLYLIDMNLGIRKIV